jgi:uncharacterized protein YjiK
MPVLENQPGFRRQFLAWMWGLILLGLLVVLMGYTLRLDNRLYARLFSPASGEEATGPSLGLPDYQVVIEAKPVAGIEKNLSGLAFDPDRDLLWAVSNRPCVLLALNRSGEVMTRYQLEGFQDVEAVCYAGQGLLIVAEERRRNLVMIPVPQNGQSLRRDDFPFFTFQIGPADNRGFEGLGYDLKGNRLFLTKEQRPPEVFEITGVQNSMEGKLSLKVHDIIDQDKFRAFASDLSSVEYDPRTGHLLLLSEQSKMLWEMSAQGKMIGLLPLVSGSAGLEHSIPHPEGVALDSQGRIYMVSEPNLFYSFTRK